MNHREEDMTSGFVGKDFLLQEESSFTNVQLFYESASGYNRLFRCERYGRIHLFKTLKEYYAGNHFYENALRKEFNIGYQLEHPNICRTLGWEYIPCLGNGILLEYVDGMTLKAFMEQRKLTRPFACKFIRELCEALGYLHNKQIIHRDLKPENILITYNGSNVKLIDFSLSDCDYYDMLKLPAGTRYYIAPEALQEGVQPNLEMDIYSLGVVIGEMANLLHDKRLTALSRKCTQRRPENRYHAAGEIVADLSLGRRRSFYRYAGVAAGVVALVALFVGTSRMNSNAVGTFPVYGNYSDESACRRLLSDERIRLHKDSGAVSAADSMAFMKRLREAFEKEYPLPVQRSSQMYKKHWESLQKEAIEILTRSHSSFSSSSHSPSTTFSKRPQYSSLR